ncbi:hypothetical protein ABTZ98_15995 [Streptomyces bacillaris]|uniref:hypothetical protein n=1 Tax=Streptomyces cavourensis TaxID=67258 RepID=UPI00227851F1|nr:hypothetical protein [Streptomyces cavourensis]WAE64278.1 hypothetical protein OUQ49_00280 [Streptomyces cavourensis]
MTDLLEILRAPVTGLAGDLVTSAPSLLLVGLLAGALLLCCGISRPVSKVLRLKLAPRTLRRMRRTIALSFLSGAARAVGSAVVIALIWWAQQNNWLC